MSKNGLSFAVKIGRTETDSRCLALEQEVQRLRVQRGQKVQLLVDIAAGRLGDFEVFQLDAAGKVIPKAPFLEIDQDGNYLFSSFVPIGPPRPTSSCANLLTTKWPQNTVWIAKREQTAVSVACFSLVVQYGRFFIVVEETQKFEAYLLDGQAVFPSCSWQELNAKILSAFANPDGYGINLPSLEKYCQPLAFDPSILQANQAWVDWYNVCKGYGAVILRDGRKARVHWQNIKPTKRKELIRLRSGDLISYKHIAEPNMTTANGTKFEWEIYGVALAVIPEAAQVA
jgi:hypothetical protein